jgi:acyl-CoA reductase-like NAD-dependent aldehyde dehydrogenase
MQVAAYHLPRGIARPPSRRAPWRRGASEPTARDAATDAALAAAELEIPEVTPSFIDLVAGRLHAGGEALARMPLAERIGAIDRAAARWLAPSFALRRLALEKLPILTGYPAATVAAALDALWQALRAPELAAVAHAEHPAARASASHAPDDAGARVAPPRLAVHVLTGNVPGAGVFGMVAALLAGVPSLVKTARREPLLPALIAGALASEDARLGAALAVVPWLGGETPLDAAALGAADLVLAYGRAETLEGIAAHQPRRLLRFGPRVSIGLVAREARDRRTAARLARQVALFDQQGCLSPQLVVVEEGEPAATTRFAAAVAAELGRLDRELPRAPLGLEEAATAWRHLERARWREQEGEPVSVHADPAGRYSVLCDRRGEITTSPLNRHLIVVPVPSFDAAMTPLRALAGLVEAVGYAGPEHRLEEAATVATACGAHRLCPLDRLQAPPFAWRQSGHRRLASFFVPAAPIATLAAADTAA